MAGNAVPVSSWHCVSPLTVRDLTNVCPRPWDQKWEHLGSPPLLGRWLEQESLSALLSLRCADLYTGALS